MTDDIIESISVMMASLWSVVLQVSKNGLSTDTAWEQYDLCGVRDISKYLFLFRHLFIQCNIRICQIWDDESILNSHSCWRVDFIWLLFLYKYKIVYVYILVNIMRKNSCNLYSVSTLEVGVNTVRQRFVLFNEIQTQMFINHSNVINNTK